MGKRSIFKKVLLALIIAVVVIGTTSLISYASFGVANPIASGIGLFKVTFTDTTFAEVQNAPKVIFFKQDYGIVKAMEEHGYVFLEDEQLGSMLVFEKDGIKYSGIGDGGRISFFRSE